MINNFFALTLEERLLNLTVKAVAITGRSGMILGRGEGGRQKQITPSHLSVRRLLEDGKLKQTEIPSH